MHVVGRGDRIAVGNDDDYRIRLYDGSGKLLFLIHQDRERVRVSSAHAEAVIQEKLTRVKAPGATDRFEQAFREVPLPSNFPTYESLRLGSEGELWVEEYRPPGPQRPSWQVFDRDGFLIFRVELTEGMTLLDMGAASVLGLTETVGGAEEVGFYRMGAK